MTDVVSEMKKSRLTCATRGEGARGKEGGRVGEEQMWIDRTRRLHRGDAAW